MVFLKYAAYGVCTLYIVWWLIGAIKRKEKHEVTMAMGAWLFFTLCFESFGNIFGLDYWFVEPTPLMNVLAVVLLVSAGLIFLVTSQTMRRWGRPEKGWEQTTELVEIGIFSVVRHPIYFSSLLVILGIFFLKISFFSIIVTPVGGLLFFLSAWYEDRWNEEKFGPKYREYRKKTKLFVPLVF